MQNSRIYLKLDKLKKLTSKPLSEGPIRTTGRIVGTTSYMATCSPYIRRNMQRKDKG